MYQRYYDGYPVSPCGPDRGETIIPDTSYSDSTTAEHEEHSSEAVLPENTEPVSECIPESQISTQEPVETQSLFNGGLLSSLQADDIILIALLIILAIESPDDIIMPLIIGYLLLGDILPF